jgi:hypothetical protein
MNRDRIPPPGPIAFLRAIFSDWLSGVSGGLSVPLTIYSLFQNSALAKTLWAISAIIAFLFAVYRIWSKERTRVVELHGRPELTINCLLTGSAVNGEYLIGLYNSNDNVATNVSMSNLTTDKGAVIEFSVVATVLKAATATWMDYKMKLGQTPVPGGNNLIHVLKLSTTLQTGQRSASYPVSLSFSNYGQLDRWETDFSVNCDFNQYTVSFVPGACRKLIA